MDPWGHFVWVTNHFFDNIDPYSINHTTGALTSIGPNVAAGTYPTGAAVDTSGSFTYVVNYGSNDISAYTINQKTGLLTSLGPNVPAGAFPYSIAIASYFP
jgi:6-phosphogluconolactonase